MNGHFLQPGPEGGGLESTGAGLDCTGGCGLDCTGRGLDLTTGKLLSAGDDCTTGGLERTG